MDDTWVETCPHQTISLSTARKCFRELVLRRGTDNERLEILCAEATCRKNTQGYCFLSDTANHLELVLSLRVKLFEFEVIGQPLCDKVIQRCFTPSRIKFALGGLKFPMCKHLSIDADRISPTYESLPTLYSELCKKCRSRHVATGCEIEAHMTTEDGKSLVNLWITVLRNLGSLDSFEDPGWQLHTMQSYMGQVRSTRVEREKQWKEWIDFMEHIRLLWTTKLKQSPSTIMIPKSDRYTRHRLSVLSRLFAKRPDRLVYTGNSLQEILDDLQETKNAEQQHSGAARDPAPTGADAGATVTSARAGTEGALRRRRNNFTSNFDAEESESTQKQRDNIHQVAPPPYAAEPTPSLFIGPRGS
jgi:hypothetical protein